MQLFAIRRGEMKRIFLIVLLILPISFAECAAKARTLSYCLEYKLQGDTGREKIELGIFVARLDLKRAGNKMVVSFSDTMPDSGQVIVLKNQFATAHSGGRYTFWFEDNWGNRGEGSVQLGTRRATIHFPKIIYAKESWSRNVVRGYGNFTLASATCVTDPIFFHRKPPS